MLRAYTLLGSYHAAAEQLGVSPQTVRHHLNALRSRIGAISIAHAVYLLWLPYIDHAAECVRDQHDACAPTLAIAELPSGPAPREIQT
jgi:hypothetical protein